MALTEQDVEAYECPSCGDLRRHKEASCCGESREAVEATVKYDEPEIESVIKTVFNLSSTDLAICRMLMTNGEATVNELTNQLPWDKSTINRRLNHLVELGIVEKQSRILKQGGVVHVYSPAPIDDIHRQFQLGLYAWLADAEALLDEMHQERLKRMVEEAEVDALRDDADESDTFRVDRTEVESTGKPDSRADGGERDSRVEESETETTNESESQTDEVESGSLLDQLWGWDRS